MGVPITGITRRGKVILVHLKNKHSLMIHLKLTGQLVYRQLGENKEEKRFGAGHPSKSLAADLPDKTTRVVFELDAGGALYFNDMRKFGWIKICATNLLSSSEPINKLGPDALSVGRKEFVQLLKGRKKSVKACLLDQTIIAGCGNIYADESLWFSGTHPSILACDLDNKQLASLHRHLRRVLRLSIERGGSSIQDYVDSRGQKGEYGNFLKVYQRTEQPCPRCGTGIRRIVVAGRGTHLCPKCQAL